MATTDPTRTSDHMAPICAAKGGVMRVLTTKPPLSDCAQSPVGTVMRGIT